MLLEPRYEDSSSVTYSSISSDEMGIFSEDIVSWCPTLKKGSGDTQYKKKVQTRMQSVTYLFRNITALSIIDIINQLLRATESGRDAWVTYCSPCGSPVAAKFFKGALSWGKNDWNGRQFVEGLVSYHQAPIFVTIQQKRIC